MRRHLMKCLSVRQPWAAWIVLGAKRVENRTWRTSYRGPLLIHAGRVFEHVELGAESSLEVLKAMAERPHMERSTAITGGAIIGMVELVDCLPCSSSAWWRTGAVAWLLESPRVFAHPIPYRGRLGLFDVPEEVVWDVLFRGDGD